MLLFSHSVMIDSFVTPRTVAHQAPLSMRLPRQKYWSELPFPTPGDLPDPGIKPVSPASQVDSSPLSYGGSPYEGKCLWKNFATGKLNLMEINSVQGQLYNSEKPEIPIFMCQNFLLQYFKRHLPFFFCKEITHYTSTSSAKTSSPLDR